jgi:hypothetical protein
MKWTYFRGLGQSEEQEKECVALILKKIKKDVEKYIKYYEDSSISFGEAYEEITALYVFSEIYVTID